MRKIQIEYRRQADINASTHPTGRLIRPKYRADIDGLRGIAVLSVVGFHAFPETFKGGFIGVDVFFVISGFLISSIIIGSLDRGSFSLSHFYSRRIRRIFPALIVVLVATYAIGWFLLLAEEYKQLGRHIAGGAGFISNFLLWQDSGYFDAAAEAKPLVHLWSLGVEEQFYIIWPLLLYLAWKRRFSLLLLTGAIAIISFSLNVAQVQGNAIAAFYSPATRIWELLIGGVLAYLSLHKTDLTARTTQAIANRLGPDSRNITAFQKQDRLRHVASILGIVVIAVTLFLMSKDRLFPGWWALLPILGAYLLIAAGPHGWVNRTILSSPFIVWFGLISFPLYLWHWPLLSFALMSAPAAYLWQTKIVVILVSVALAWLTYRLVETPIRFGMPGKMTVAALCTLLTVTGGAGYNAYRLDGWSDRFNTAMSDAELARQRARYWSRKNVQAFDRDYINVIVFGDSQAYDVTEALSHDSRLRAKLFRSNYTCTAFSSPTKGFEKDRDMCRDSFESLIKSEEIQTADVLIYAHAWVNDAEEKDLYAEGLKHIRDRNGRLRIYFFGYKPFLGSSWVSINAITRQHRGRVGMNEFLESTKVILEAENRYAQTLAMELGVEFMDVSKIFCDGGCPFYEAEQFSYFDQNHWTEVGAKRFFDRLARTAEYKELATKSRIARSAP